MGSRFIILFLVSVVFAVAPPAKAELTPNCTHVETSLTSCLRYAVGEDPMPLPNCCPQVRKEDFVCLCDLVRVAFNGEPLGPYTLDYYRTVNLSTICNITGADIKLCGLVLRLPRGSPDFAAFNGSTPRNGGFSLRASYSIGIASAVISAVVHSFISF